MASALHNISKYSRFNISPDESDIHIFIKEYRTRIYNQLAAEDEGSGTPFVSFGERRLSFIDSNWIAENQKRFIKNTDNDQLGKLDFLSECGFIYCMIYTPDGEYIIAGHSTGLIQMEEQSEILAEFANNIHLYYRNERFPKIWYPMFYKGKSKERNRLSWVNENYEKFIKGTPNDIIYNRWLFSEMGAVTTLEYSPDGSHIIVGHSSGLIQMRHGTTGIVLCTLRNVQFPPKPVYALEYSKTEERVCYAACMDGAVYRIEIPHMTAPKDDPPEYCIRADPALECLNMQYYGAPGISSYSTPFITQRFPALSLGLTADQSKMIVGYGDNSIKMYDMETQAAIITYKVHKLRLQFIPKKLQRIHFGQVCALRCHPQKVFTFASGAWDKTLRIWDTRCKVGCVMTFEGVNICSDSIDLNRDECIAGSWQPTEALTVWDLVAKKNLNVVRVQNRRPDVDGEYIYACRYWHSTDFNRKGKYGIIGGSGTNCVEVINLHNRYITCSYPAVGTILAVTSYQDRIAFGGTAPVFNIVSFHDPKHEKDKYQKQEEFEVDNTIKTTITVFEDTNDDNISTYSTEPYPEMEQTFNTTTTSNASATSYQLSETPKMPKILE